MGDDKYRKLIEMGRSMSFFVKEIFGDQMQAETPPFHETIFRDFDDDSVRNLLIVAPRGHGKSVIASEFFPIYRILYSDLLGREPEFIPIISKTAENAENSLLNIKRYLEDNDKLRYYFGDWGETTSNKWNEGEAILRNGAVVRAKGMGGSIHGLRRGKQRPSIIVLDDPEDDKNAGTIEAMQKNQAWFTKALMPTVDPRRCRILCIGTMINEGCLIDVLTKLPQWKTHWYKAIPDKFDESGVPIPWDGHSVWPVLWPEWQPFGYLMDEKDKAERMGQGHVWWMNYQNEFRTGENQPFKRKYFKKYSGECVKIRDGKFALRVDKAVDEDGNTCIEQKFIPLNIFWGYDPASSESSRADCTAIEFWGMDARKNCYLLWKFNKRVDALVAAEEFFAQAKYFAPITGNIETVQAQETIRSFLRHKMNEEGTWVNGLDKKNNPRSKKSERILSDLWRYKNGMIYVRDGEDDDFIAQAIQYVIDKESQHEDMLDAQYYALKDAWPCDQDWEDTMDKVEESARRICTIGLDDLVDEGVTWMGV